MQRLSSRGSQLGGLQLSCIKPGKLERIWGMCEVRVALLKIKNMLVLWVFIKLAAGSTKSVPFPSDLTDRLSAHV